MAHQNRRHRGNGRPQSEASGPSAPDAAAAAEPSQPTAAEAAVSKPDADFRLLETLFHELFQAEQSAKVHTLREADRLGEVPPAAALRAVSAHASRIMEELPALAQKCDLPISYLGKTAGFMLSMMRQWVLDHVVEPERSYRVTLLGMRHGVDLVTLISQLAQAGNHRELAQWCSRWLSERAPLVEAAAVELAWFAQSPQEALGTSWERDLLWKLMHLWPPGRKPSRARDSTQPQARAQA